MSAKVKQSAIKQGLKLLSPSEVSSVICVVVSILVALGTIYINRYRTNSLKLEYKYYQTHRTILNSKLVGSFLKTSFVRNLPFICFWIIVALAVCFVILDIYKALNSSKKLKANTSQLKNILLRLFLRAILVAVSLPYLLLYFREIIPFCAKVAILATSASNTLLVAAYIVMTVVIGSLATHIDVILVRLVSIRARLFSYEPR